jgi:uncharacterized protein (TIGR03790 family)
MNRLTSWMLALSAVPVFLFALPTAGRDLNPEQLLIIANKEMRHSVELADYYMKQRSIPEQNLIKVQTSLEEFISREEYEKEIASPVRSFVTKNDPEGIKYACIVLMYGIPLRVQPPLLSAGEKKQLADLEKIRSALGAKIRQLGKSDSTETNQLNSEMAAIEKKILHATKSDCGASVDSEIALVMEPSYSLEGWLPNRYFIGFRGKEIEKMPQRVLIVSRLDGPSDSIVRRIVADAIQVEKQGLAGIAYFDARWPNKGDKNPNPTSSYDASIHGAARIVEKSNKMKVMLDDRESLFQSGEAKNAALYCGWYSLGQYIDAFTWAKGAIGFHVASLECSTLKSKSSSVWCKTMLEKGVAATLGPVSEPYLQSFPQPEVFFGCLLDGYSLSQCYAVSNPFWSWQMVLIGDPLYRPFKHKAD